MTHKSFHALLHADGPVALPEDIQTENWGKEGDFVLKCPVPTGASWPQARAALQALLARLPDGCRPVLTADTFACVPAQTLWTDGDGVEHRVSCGYANPLLAFEAGVTHGEEVLRHAAF